MNACFRIRRHSPGKKPAPQRRVMRHSALAALFLLAAPLISPAAAENWSGDGMTHQIRIYEIFESNKPAFHARFRDHAARIMKKYDFDIIAMWESRSPQKTEFVYVLQWPDEKTMIDRWARFMADREWSDIKAKSAAKHGKLVGGIQDRVLHEVDYSPRL